MLLTPRPVCKPWGRSGLPGSLNSSIPIGEIIFDDPAAMEAELLIKLIFTQPTSYLYRSILMKMRRGIRVWLGGRTRLG